MFETVDGPGSVNGQACLALDKNSNSRIAYAGVGAELMLTSRDPGQHMDPRGTVRRRPDENRTNSGLKILTYLLMHGIGFL